MRPFQMKLLPLICATMLVASCPSWASDQQGRFLEVEDDYGVDTTTFDLSTVQMIQPGRFGSNNYPIWEMRIWPAIATSW